MDFRDGEVLFRSSVFIKSISVPFKLFMPMFERHVTTILQFGDSVVKAILTQPTPETYHFGITCDHCQTTPIRGERYKCMTCRDFDLCTACKGKGVHSEHKFKTYASALSGPVGDASSDTKPSGAGEDKLLKLLQLLALAADSPQKEGNTIENVALHPQKQLPDAVSPKVVSSNQIQFSIDDKGKKIRLGKGGFSTVYLAKWHGLEVAVKVIKEDLRPDVKELFKREVIAMSTLHHPHIILMLGLCEEPPSIILPVMKRGSLQDVIAKSAAMPFKTKLKYLIDAAKGMAFVHGNHILHGDLKPLNVLVDENNVAYIADFGLAIIKASTTALVAGGTINAFSPLYASPEVLANGKLTPEADVYSFGIMMWEMATCKTPFLGAFATQMDLQRKITAGLRPDASHYPSDTPQAFKDLAAECWHMDPSSRPNFLTVLDRLEKMV